MKKKIAKRVDRPKTVLTSGVFDLLHYGHLRFLEEAKKVGGKDAKLVVIIARDSTVEKEKGRKPILPESQRRAIVEALKPVDSAILGYETRNYEKVIEKIKPDIIVVGHDQDAIERSVKEIVRQKGLNIRIVKIRRFGDKELASSSQIRKKLIKYWK